MERYSDRAIEIINDLHTERLDYDSEYTPLIDAANQLSAYEDTGFTPEQIPELVNEYLEICGGDCSGDSSVGLPKCPFYEFPDVDMDGKLVQGGCRLSACI